MFALLRKTFFGSYARLISTRRAYFSGPSPDWSARAGVA
jgi:hypothetical protein